LIRGKLAFSQTKIDLVDEVNFELSKKDLQEAVKLSGYTQKEKTEFNNNIHDKTISSTQRL